jgi:hypothetical protein
MRILSLTTAADHLQTLAPWLREHYVHGRDYGLSVAWGPEWAVTEAPYPLRLLEEYSRTAAPSAGEELQGWQLAAARRALLEERPDVLLTAPDDLVWQALEGLVGDLGIRWLRPQGAPQRLEPYVAAPPKPRLQPELADVFRGSGEHDGLLSRAEDPAAALRTLLAGQRRLSFREPLNLAYAGSRQRVCYGSYDNDFALAPADLDLRELLRAHLRPDQFHVSVAGARNGTAGDGPFLEACDRRIPVLCIEIDQDGLAPRHWLDRFAAGRSARLNLLLIDHHNVAGSGANLAWAVNRYTESRATVLCGARHPFINHSGPYCPTLYADEGWSSAHLDALRSADVLVFTEEEDAASMPWPDEFRKVAERKPQLSLYVGQRVHRGVAARQAPGRTVLVGLPHIWRMYPECRFFPGFFPPAIEELPLRPPSSHSDGVVKVLHTPSLPHATLHRYLYHKDTDAYLDAAQVLKTRYPQARFLQWAGVPHERLMQARLDCDIAFHQLRGFMGMSGNESMWLQRPTIQALDRENRHRHLEFWGLDTEFPWLQATQETLVDVLDTLLRDREHREETGRRCRQFMLDFFRPEVGIVPFLHYCSEATA